MNSFRLALATMVITTSACNAVAQTATVYGIIDLGITRASGSLTSATKLNSSESTGSRLGFKAEEDMGNGFKARVVLEGSIAPDSGVGLSSNTNNQASGSAVASAGSQGFTFNRQSIVGLSGPFGELRLGRDYTPSFLAVALYDPFGSNSSFVMPQNFQGSITGIALPNGARSSNAIGYSTPSAIGSVTEGFQGRFMYGLGENASNAGATANDGDYLGAAFHMQRGPIDVGVAFAKYWLAAMGDIRETVIVGTLRLGDGKLYAQYLQDDTGSANSMRGHLLGGSYVAGAVEWKATWSRSDTESRAGLKIGTSNKYAAGVAYSLSKRTALYANAALVSNSNGARGVPFPGIGASSTAPNEDTRAYGIGVRHSF